MRYLEKFFLSLAVSVIVLPMILSVMVFFAHDTTVNLVVRFINILGLRRNEIGPVLGIIPALGFMFGYFGYYITRQWRLGREHGEKAEAILEDGTKPFTGSIWGDALVLIGLVIGGFLAFYFYTFR